MGKRMKSLDLTPAEAAILGALLWRFRFTLARMTGQRERYVKCSGRMNQKYPACCAKQLMWQLGAWMTISRKCLHRRAESSPRRLTY